MLLLIFLPKIMMQRRYAGLSKADQKKMLKMALCVRRNSSKTPSDGIESGHFTGSAYMYANAVQAVRNGSSQYLKHALPSRHVSSESYDKKSSFSVPSQAEHTSQPEQAKRRDSSNRSVQFQSPQDNGGSHPLTIQEESCAPALEKKVECNDESDSPIAGSHTKEPDATTLFQQVLSLKAKESSSLSNEYFLQEFLALVDRSKLSSQEQTALDMARCSLQGVISA